MFSPSTEIHVPSTSGTVYSFTSRQLDESRFLREKSNRETERCRTGLSQFTLPSTTSEFLLVFIALPYPEVRGNYVINVAIDSGASSTLYLHNINFSGVW